VFGSVKRCVDAYLHDHPQIEVRTDRVVSFDVTNRMIDGACYLFFGEDRRYPALVAKAARTAAGKAVFEIEHRNLETLEVAGLNAGRPTVPAPLGTWREGETLITLQSALEGALMKNVPGASLFSPGEIDGSFDGVFGWWLRFQDRLGVRRVELSGEVYAREVLDEVARFRNRYLLDRGEMAWLDRRFARERALQGAELPLMARHGDFCAANLALQPHGIGVFDWEFPLDWRLPLFDLFFFFSSVRFPYGRGGESSHSESFAAVFWEESYFRAAVRRRLGQACERFAVPGEALGDLFVLSLIHLANMKYEGLLVSHGLPELDHPSDEEKRARWSAFDRADKDAPLACIRDGVFENLRLVVRRGVPEF